MLRSGTLISTPDAKKLHFFKIDLTGILPPEPPDFKPTIYYVRVVPQGSGLAASPTVRILYKKNTNKTTFTFKGLYPEFFQPMPIYINLHTFRLNKADEENDEEPYLIPIVAYLDGTTFTVADFANSSVRVETAKQTNVHGNIPRSNTLGSGVDVSIPKDVGYFESTILPINIEMVETLKPFCDPTKDEDHCLIRLKNSTQSTVVWILVAAFEEDATDDDVTNVVRDTIVQGLRDEFNKCVQGMTLVDFIAMMNDGLDLEETVTSNEEGVTFCGYTATAEDSILDQIRKSLVAMGKSAGKDEAFLDAWTFLHGGIINHFDDVIDPDDYIGFDWIAVTYDELMREPGAIPFKLKFHKSDNAGAEEAAVRPVDYEVLGAISRCQKNLQTGECVGVKKPLLPKFP